MSDSDSGLRLFLVELKRRRVYRVAVVAANRLARSGIGWVDAHLLASARLGGVGLWMLDRPLARVARELGLYVEPD